MIAKVKMSRLISSCPVSLSKSPGSHADNQGMLGKSLLLSQFVDDPTICQFTIPGLGAVGDIHVDTLVLTWVSMGGILVAGTLTASRLESDGPGGGAQAAAEGFYNWMQSLCRDQIGEKFKPFFPLIAAIFIFVLIGNFIGVGPWRACEHLSWWWKFPGGEPFEIASPTTDFNVTAGLALISLLTYMGAGLWAHGVGYIKLWSPVWPESGALLAWIKPMFWIEWLDLIIRPSTLALRLMCVITGDEMLRLAFLMILPIILPTAVMGFELFIGVIQAFVFALLTSVYIGLTLSEHH